MAALALGFADPVRASQSTFKAIMWAMARPGRPVDLASALAPPAPLTPELAAVALALLDFETSFWLDGPLAAAPDVVEFLRFHTGAPRVDDPAVARFALVADPARLAPFATFALGEPDYPDRSATLVMSVDRFTDGPLLLEGPGIKGEQAFGAVSLPRDFAGQLHTNRALFPLGLDFILTAPGAVVGLPRSARLVKED